MRNNKLPTRLSGEFFVYAAAKFDSCENLTFDWRCDIIYIYKYTNKYIYKYMYKYIYNKI